MIVALDWWRHTACLPGQTDFLSVTFPLRLPVLAALLLAAFALPAFGQQPAPTPPILPDPKLTPGDVLDVTLADIQEHGYSSKVRNVPVSVKREVYASYGIEHWNKGEYEVDHLISLSLGGSNSKKNLWPESYLTEPWNARTKDALEFRLLALVRAGKVDLHTAQQEMAHDWIAAYKKYVSPEPLSQKGEGKKRVAGTPGVPDTKPDRDGEPDTETESEHRASNSSASAAANPVGDHAGQVWVNTKSGVIWKPGTTYYGKTKAGKYMSEADALAAGYHNAK